MQAPRADVLGVLVHLKGDLGDAAHAIPVKSPERLRSQQRLILRRQRRVGLGQDAHEVAHLEGVELHADRQPPLQLGNEIRGFRQVKAPEAMNST